MTFKDLLNKGINFSGWMIKTTGKILTKKTENGITKLVIIYKSRKIELFEENGKATKLIYGSVVLTE